MNPAKRKLEDDNIKQEPVEEASCSHLVKMMIGDYVQYSPREAIQKLLPDPAYLQAGCTPDANEYRIRLPPDVEPLPAHMVLLQALSPNVPLNWKSTSRGLTLDKLRKAASYFKINGDIIGLPQKTAPVVPKKVTVSEIQCAFTSQCNTAGFMDLSLEDILKLTRENYLAVKTEMDVYQAVMNWCHHEYPSRWKKEIFDVLLAEIRWDLLADALEVAAITAMGHLKDALMELHKYLFPTGIRHTVHPRQRHFAENVYLFYADRNQVFLNRYDWRTNKLDNVVLPTEIKPWSAFKAMGPFVGNKLWIQVERKKSVKNLLWSLLDNTVQWLFNDDFVSCETYPMACIDGRLYGWDFRGLPDSYVGYKCDPVESPEHTHDVTVPKHWRTEAAYDSWNGKFYYCGGTPVKGKTFDAVQVVEVYDTCTDKWSRMPDMREARRCFAAKVCDGYLYVAGGACSSTGFGILQSCERLNLKSPTGQWEAVASLKMMRYGHSMFVANNQVYICGGFTCQGVRANSMERYDAQRNCWVCVCTGSACELVSTCATAVLPSC